MAETKPVVALEIKTGDAIKNVQDLKNNIAILKSQLNDTKATFEDNARTAEQLRENQNALKDAMYSTTKTADELIESSKKEGQSYNDLVHTMAELKMAWRATTDEQERAKLGSRIDAINTQLKDMDATVGNYSRNVGNYTNSILDAFKQMPGVAGKVANGVKNVNGVMTALSANPVMTTISLLSNLLNKVTEGLKSSEENTKAVSDAMAIFSVVGDGVTKVINVLGAALGKVAGFFADILEKLGYVNEAMEFKKEIAQDELALAKETRENTMQNADAELEISKIKAEAADKLNNSAEERLKKLEEASELEKQIAERNKKQAEDEYNLIVKKNSVTDSSTEDLKKEAEAYAKMVKAQTDYFNKTKELTAQINDAHKQIQADAKAAADAAKAAADARLNATKALIDAELGIVEVGSEEELELQKQKVLKQLEIDKSATNKNVKDRETRLKTIEALETKAQMQIEALDKAHNQTRIAQQIQYESNLLEVMSKGTADYYETLIDQKQLISDSIEKLDTETQAQYEARVIAANKELLNAQKQYDDWKVNQEHIAMENRMAAYADGSKEYLKAAMELKAYELDHLQQMQDESDEEFLARKIQAQNALKDAITAFDQWLADDEHLAMENRMNALNENSLEYLDAAVELKKYELDTLHQLEGESEEQFRSRQLAADKAYRDAKINLFKYQVSQMQNYTNAVSSLMDSLAGVMEEGTENDKAAAERAKSLKIASATIDTISGAIAAFMGCQELPQPYGAIIGAIQAATVTATGMSEISKLRNTKISTNGSSGSVSAPAITKAPTISQNIPQTSLLTSASDEAKLNEMFNDQKVYILQSDLEASGKQVEIQQGESSF